MMSSLGSMVRGENFENKKIFLELKGLEVVREAILSNPASTRIRDRGINIYKDIINYE